MGTRPTTPAEPNGSSVAAAPCGGSPEPIAEPDGASFRDPAGRVHHLDGRVLRTLSAPARDEFAALAREGLFDELVREGLLVSATMLDAVPAVLAHEHVAAVVEHPVLPFVSYPYEWGFRALKRASTLR